MWLRCDNEVTSFLYTLTFLDPDRNQQMPVDFNLTEIKLQSGDFYLDPGMLKYIKKK